jgi:hypothetical protein
MAPDRSGTEHPKRQHQRWAAASDKQKFIGNELSKHFDHLLPEKERGTDYWNKYAETIDGPGEEVADTWGVK